MSAATIVLIVVAVVIVLIAIAFLVPQRRRTGRRRTTRERPPAAAGARTRTAPRAEPRPRAAPPVPSVPDGPPSSPPPPPATPGGAGEERAPISGTPESRRGKRLLYGRRPLRRRRSRTGGKVDEHAEADDAPEPGTSPALPAEPVIARTPHLDAPEQLPTRPGSEFAVEVRTDMGRPEAHEEVEGIVIEAPPHVDRVDLAVLLSTTAHFAVRGDEYKPFTIERDEPQSKAVKFSLEVAADPPDEDAGIAALFVYRGRPCGRVARAWRWSEDVATATSPKTAVAASVPVHVESREPDLSVLIDAPVNDGINFKCAVLTKAIPGLDKPSWHDWALPQAAGQFVSDQLADFSDPRQDSKRALQSAGYEFFKAAPRIFQEVLWRLIDDNKRPQSIYIASAEPHMPWELMIPCRTRNGFEELRPLGVEFSVGRWTRSDSTSPPARIPAHNSFIVVPQYKRSRQLDATAEVGFLGQQLGGTVVRPATINSLDQRFAQYDASVLHFVCHGDVLPQKGDVIFLDNEEELRATAIRALAGFKALCGRMAPFVFLNACSTGQQVASLSGGAGFPVSFGDIGVRAMIAPLWPVEDRVASAIAVEIYKEALKPSAPPVAEILRRVRARAYGGDKPPDTYAAYCFYGDPSARFEVP